MENVTDGLYKKEKEGGKQERGKRALNNVPSTGQTRWYLTLFYMYATGLLYAIIAAYNSEPGNRD